MRIFFALFLFLILLKACDSNGEKTPDVSNIQLDLKLLRFDEEFAALDTVNLLPSLVQLKSRYPQFLDPYLNRILELNGPDEVEGYLNNPDIQLLNDSVGRRFDNMSETKRTLESGLRYAKYYFPTYPTPSVVTFVGRLNNRVVVLPGMIGVGLEWYMGPSFSLYKLPQLQADFPQYITRRFEPAYIPLHVTEALLDDLFPEPKGSMSLIQQAVEKGRRWWVVTKLLPDLPDTVLTGYTKKQLDACYRNEGTIWGFFLQNGLLEEKEPAVLRDYIGDAPTTQAFGGDSPGNVGVFIGWQIVKAYAKAHPEATPQQIMQMDLRQLFAASKYKPR